MKKTTSGRVFVAFTFLIAVVALILAIAAYRQTAQKSKIKPEAELNKLKLRISLLEAKAEVIAAKIYLESKEKIASAIEKLEKAKEKLDVAVNNAKGEAREKINSLKNRLSKLSLDLRQKKVSLAKEKEKAKEAAEELDLLIQEESSSPTLSH